MRYLLLLTMVTLTMMTSSARAARILGIFPVACRSHQRVFSALTLELAHRGHELVILTPFPIELPQNSSLQMRQIDLMTSYGNYYKEIMSLDLYSYDHPVYYPLFYWFKAIPFIELIFKDTRVRALLLDKGGFDLVICEDIITEGLCGFAEYFKAPKIIMSSLGGYHITYYPVGNPLSLAHVPNVFLGFRDTMSFMERLVNTVYTMLWELGDRVFYMWRQEILRKQFFGTTTRTVMEMRFDADLVLVNNHVSLGYPRPLLPNMIEVGGLHIKQTAPPLPDDLQQFLDEATEGAIYFSMGSNLRNDAMDVNKMVAILEAFNALPRQRVLMKWESNTTIPGYLSSNIRLHRWLPQQSILAHRNLRVFVTHGGLLSIQEALHYGVPLIGIPVFSDQAFNIRKAVADGYAISFEINKLSKQSILAALKATLHDPRYREAAMKRSAVLHDQPETPLDRAVFWTEYIIRHKGAPHLRSASKQLAWYQLYLLDVAATLFIFCLTLGVGAVLLLRWRLRNSPRILHMAKQINNSFKILFTKPTHNEERKEWISSEMSIKKAN